MGDFFVGLLYLIVAVFSVAMLTVTLKIIADAWREKEYRVAVGGGLMLISLIFSGGVSVAALLEKWVS